MLQMIQNTSSCVISYCKAFQTIVASFHNRVDLTGMYASTLPLMMIWLSTDVIYRYNLLCVTKSIYMNHTKAQYTLNNVDNDIDNMVTSCKKCQDFLPFNSREPLVCKDRPIQPLQEICVDFVAMVVMHCWLLRPEFISMDHNPTSIHLPRALRQSFCWTAVPDILWKFTSKHFCNFAKLWGFIHKVSSPHYPQNNGKIKSMVHLWRNSLSHPLSWWGCSLSCPSAV